MNLLIQILVCIISLGLVYIYQSWKAKKFGESLEKQAAQNDARRVEENKKFDLALMSAIDFSLMMAACQAEITIMQFKAEREAVEEKIKRDREMWEIMLTK